MKRHALLRQFAPVFAGLLLAVTSAFAKESHRVKVPYAASVGGTVIEPGEYKLVAKSKGGDTTVNLVKGKNVVAITHGQWVERDKTYDDNALVYDKAVDGSRAIIEMRFAGSNKALVLNESAAEARSTGGDAAPATESAPATPAAKPGSSGDGNPQVRFLGKPSPIQRRQVQPQPLDDAIIGFQPNFKQPVYPALK